MADDTNQQSTPSVITNALVAVDAVAPSDWRLRLAKFSMQLLLGARRGAAVYSMARDNLDEIEALSKLNKEGYALATQQIIDDPAIIEAYKNRLLNNFYRKNENLDAVVRGAENEASRLLSYDPVEQPVDSTGEAPAGDDEADGAIDPDWSSTFVPFAEAADSDQLRTRLSRVLAGEARKPGSFPRSTIRAIFELEKGDIEALMSVSNLIIGEYIIDGESIPLETTNRLIESQIIHDVGSRIFTKSISAKPGNAGGLTGYNYAISIMPIADFDFSFQGFLLTRLGRSVVSLLDKYDEKAALRNLCERIPKENLQIIIMGNFKYDDESRFSLSNWEAIWIRG